MNQHVAPHAVGVHHLLSSVWIQGSIFCAMRNPINRWPWRALLLFQCCWAFGGCNAVAYPVKHYQAVYTKAGLETPTPDAAKLSQLSQRDAARVAHGRYLVAITGCAACHTDGALIGEPNAVRQLSGSQLGIAYTDPVSDDFPGVAYPSNLTPDAKTGLGNWTDAQIAAAIRTGSSSGGPGHLMVMPWPLYESMTDDDVDAIVAYLRSIPAVDEQVPTRVKRGTRASTSYVYFGVFRSGPELRIH
jgi:mono/diheme cytochrome c family protein